MLTSTQLTDEWKKRIAKEARSWKGARYSQRGRSFAGIDCVGVIVNVAHACDFTDYDTTDYSHRASGTELLSHLDEHCDRVLLRNIDEGDILVTRDPNERLACHCGIVVLRADGRFAFVHSYLGKRKVVEDLYEDWKPFSIRAYRYRISR